MSDENKSPAIPEYPELKLISITEAMELLGVSDDTLHRWERRGLIKSVRMTQRGPRRYRYDDIKNMIEARRK